MSNVKIEGNASGTGTLTIAAPNTNTDRTLTLPDSAGTIVAASGGVLPALDGSNLTNLPASGKVLQVVQAQKTDVFSSSSTSYVDVTGMSLSITPSSTSSKILITVNMTVGCPNSNFTLSRLYRNGTAIAMPTTSSSYMSSMNSYAGDGLNGSSQITQVITWLDSPSTTSAITYKVQSMTTGGGAFYINARPVAQNGTTPSTITAMEIAG